MVLSYQVAVDWEAYAQGKDGNQVHFWSPDLASDLSPVEQRKTRTIKTTSNFLEYWIPSI